MGNFTKNLIKASFEQIHLTKRFELLRLPVENYCNGMVVIMTFSEESVFYFITPFITLERKLDLLPKIHYFKPKSLKQNVEKQLKMGRPSKQLKQYLFLRRFILPFLNIYV